MGSRDFYFELRHKRTNRTISHYYISAKGSRCCGKRLTFLLITSYFLLVTRCFFIRYFLLETRYFLLVTFLLVTFYSFLVTILLINFLSPDLLFPTYYTSQFCTTLITVKPTYKNLQI